MDRKLGTALGKILKGELGCRVDVEEQRALRERQCLLSGRQKLFMMYDSFARMSRWHVAIPPTTYAQSSGWGTANSRRCATLGKLANQMERQSDEQLATILFEILKHSKEGMLKDDVTRYNDGREGTARRRISS